MKVTPPYACVVEEGGAVALDGSDVVPPLAGSQRDADDAFAGSDRAAERIGENDFARGVGRGLAEGGEDRRPEHVPRHHGVAAGHRVRLGLLDNVGDGEAIGIGIGVARHDDPVARDEIVGHGLTASAALAPARS